MEKITEYLNSKGFDTFEGYIYQVPDQVTDIIEIIQSIDKEHINIMEIGFNAGHSSELFLNSKSNVSVVSFDLGDHEYVSVAKEYIDNTYPNRHRLILGDSKETVPLFIKENENFKFDILFIDGGHAYDTVKEDTFNCLQLAHKDSIVIIDDTAFLDEWRMIWNVGPTIIWYECLDKQIIKEINRKDYCLGRGMSWGNYIFNDK